jgi:uncharacterized membrane protein
MLVGMAEQGSRRIVVTWSRRARFKAEVTRRLWPIPLGFAAIAVGLAWLAAWVDREFAPGSPVTYDTGSAQATLSSIAAGMLVFIGFVFSVITFAIQYEASTYTPRLLRTIANSTALRFTLAVFLATFVYALLVLAQIEPDSEYRYSVLLAVVLVGVSLLLFLALMTEVADRARSGRTVDEVARAGCRVIERTCRAEIDAPSTEHRDPWPERELSVRSTPAARSGVVQGIDVDGIVALAAECDAVVELVPEVGGFVAFDEPLFRVHGGTATLPDAALHGSILLGAERTSDQDPRLSIRILVDIAIRALSPAINDPTTAVEALERIGDLLLLLSSRALPDGVHRDGSGRVRLVEPVPTWEDYLTLGLTEIRLYGASSPFVAHEMNRNLTALRRRAPESRRAAIDRQIELLAHATSPTDDAPPTPIGSTADAHRTPDGTAE